MLSAVPYKKAVILGAAGFIGINLAHALSKEDFDVICFDRTASPHWPKTARIIIGDFASLPAGLLRELNHALVFHLISSCRPSPSTADAANEIGQDLMTTVRYLEETKTRNLRWVFLSSGGTVYGQNNEEKIAESSATNPICSYGVVKLSIERYFALYRTLHNLDYVVTRLANPYGPWQDPFKGQGLIAAMLYKALTGDAIEIWGNGENVRDYIYITDAIQGILAAAVAGKSGETYNIGTACGLSINQLIEIISEILNVRLEVKYSTARTVDVKRNVLNPAKLINHTGWKSRTTITSGVALTAAWLNLNLKT
jgi:UDP-glucose 4-epimerase